MLAENMNSKRQRRPNVRLGEIGDFSAAFACNFSQKTKGNLGYKRWRLDSVNPRGREHNATCGFLEEKPCESLISERNVSAWVSDDLQQNRENKNPNSVTLPFESLNPEKIGMNKPILNFGPVTRKCRVMKRRGRSIGDNNNIFGSFWSSKLIPEFIDNNGRHFSEKEFSGFMLEACNDNDFSIYRKDISDHETPVMSKEASEYDIGEINHDLGQQCIANDAWKDDACCEGNNSSGKWDEMGLRVGDADGVSRWLEQLGFGKYAGVFKMHEVDEEVLPLLTLDDLKEMGVFAVGP
ncbi:uncharacterized protein LOC119986569 isoform X2 [Tripterygium wilfordii]|uniref:uncharacterized protein LOC119986569 isoform X2 n=1 Tax=Tripterygium wilfordii TaxID=458696 RepID=UPI0018F81480|nr:uncharacterized protein LOC119986569 isoform X2 [Tripterygium wilfordii]